MQVDKKDKQILEHIINYCDEVTETFETFGMNKDRFMESAPFRNACSMPIMQIGELAKKLSVSFVNNDKKMPWKAIKGMRDMFAHGYHSMNKEMIWETSTKDIPVLKKHVENILNNSIVKDNDVYRRE